MTEKHSHLGHRARLKERFLKEGLDNFKPHNLLEFLLFFSVPLTDTNTIAHAILKECKTLENVFEKSKEDLMKIKGVGEHTALFLTNFKNLEQAYLLSHSTPNEPLNTSQKLGAYLKTYFKTKEKNAVFALIMDSSMNIISSEKICDGNINEIHKNVKKITLLAYSRCACSVILAYNISGPIPPFTNIDKGLANALNERLKRVFIELIDILIVSDNSFISFGDFGCFDGNSLST